MCRPFWREKEQTLVKDKDFQVCMSQESVFAHTIKCSVRLLKTACSAVQIFFAFASKLKYTLGVTHYFSKLVCPQVGNTGPATVSQVAKKRKETEMEQQQEVQPTQDRNKKKISDKVRG